MAVAEEKITNELKTPDEWQAITGITIVDADGWGGKDGRPFTDKIGYTEWCRRMSRSTVQVKTMGEFEKLTIQKCDKSIETAKIVNKIVTDLEATYIYFLLEQNFHDSPVVQAAFYTACEKVVEDDPHPEEDVQKLVLEHLRVLKRDAMKAYLDTIERILDEVSHSARRV